MWCHIGTAYSVLRTCVHPCLKYTDLPQNMAKRAQTMLGSSLRNAVKRRDHKERDQPAFRKKR